jgi:putative hydrolase of HD superfamily
MPVCVFNLPLHFAFYFITGVSSIEKENLELSAMTEISSKLSEFSATAGSEIFNLWKEYDSASSLEAKFVKQLDKLEMLIQAFEYEKQRMGFDLDSFFAWVEQSKKITDPVLMALVSELQFRRDAEKNKSSVV